MIRQCLLLYVSSYYRYHNYNATGINPYKAFPSFKPMLDTCHVAWFTSQAAGALFCLVIFLVKLYQRNESMRQRPNTATCARISMAVWLLSFGLGLGSIWTGMPTMKSIQTAGHGMIILALLCSYTCGAGHSSTEQLQDREAERSNDLIRELKDSRAPDGNPDTKTKDAVKAAGHIQTISVQGGKRSEDIVERTYTGADDEMKCTCYQTVLFLWCSILSGKHEGTNAETGDEG